MPNYDGTGPRGQGPMTGRGMGSCFGGRRGFGCYRGFYGRRRMTKEILREDIKDMEDYLKDAKAELSDMEKDS